MKFKPKKLISLLSIYFISWSIIFIAVFIFSSAYFLRIAENNLKFSYENLNDYTNLLNKGSFDKIPKTKIFGKNGYFDILDENYNTIYSSNDLHTYTKDHLKYMWNYDYFHYNLYLLNESDSLLVKREKENTENLYYVISDNYIITTNDTSIKRELTTNQKEVLNTLKSQTNVYLYKTFKYNNKKHMLVGFASKFDENINNFIQLKILMYISYGFIYFLGIGVIIFLLHRKINNPLKKLSTSIKEYGNNRAIPEEYNETIQEFSNIYNDFIRLTKKLDEYNEIKSRFEREKQIMLANISHDLKTPITVIQGYSKAIMDKVLDEKEIIEKNKLIYNKANYISQLVTQFHQFSKLEHPDFNYNFKKENFSEYLRLYLSNKYNELIEKSVNLELEIKDEVYIAFDKNQFTRVLENLTNNAIKYNSKGISIKFYLDKNNLKISNSGISIDKSIEKDIFKPFVVADQSRGSLGSGLGLSIVEKIIKDHSFSIELINDPKTFYTVSFKITFAK